ncbi:MAG: cytochrome aa3 quinol oxidase subunit II [Bacillus sp. (in: firmicutes)]
MKKPWILLTGLFSSMLFLTGCSEWAVFDSNGPTAKIQADTITISFIIMLGIMAVVYFLFAYMLVKFRASKQPKDYTPPHMEGSTKLEVTWTVIPFIIVAILSFITVDTLNKVESTPAGYEDQEPLVIYASSSNWKWHFSYPEEGIETVNYVNIPTDRVVEFRLYSFGPITSFWVPQLGGQKYAMSDMVTKLQFVADEPLSMMGRNSNFSGEGYAHMEFEALSMKPAEFDEWVQDVKANEEELTEEEFNELLDTAHVGRKSYSSTHLEFSPPPEGHDHGSNATESNESEDADTIFDEPSEGADHSDH